MLCPGMYIIEFPLPRWEGENEFKGFGDGEGIRRSGEEIQREGVEKGVKKGRRKRRKEEKGGKRKRKGEEKKGEGK